MPRRRYNKRERVDEPVVGPYSSVAEQEDANVAAAAMSPNVEPTFISAKAMAATLHEAAKLLENTPDGQTMPLPFYFRPPGAAFAIVFTGENLLQRIFYPNQAQTAVTNMDVDPRAHAADVQMTPNEPALVGIDMAVPPTSVPPIEMASLPSQNENLNEEDRILGDADTVQRSKRNNYNDNGDDDDGNDEEVNTSRRCSGRTRRFPRNNRKDEDNEKKETNEKKAIKKKAKDDSGNGKKPGRPPSNDEMTAYAVLENNRLGLTLPAAAAAATAKFNPVRPLSPSTLRKRVVVVTGHLWSNLDDVDKKSTVLERIRARYPTIYNQYVADHGEFTIQNNDENDDVAPEDSGSDDLNGQVNQRLNFTRHQDLLEEEEQMNEEEVEEEEEDDDEEQQGQGGDNHADGLMKIKIKQEDAHPDSTASFSTLGEQRSEEEEEFFEEEEEDPFLPQNIKQKIGNDDVNDWITEMMLNSAPVPVGWAPASPRFCNSNNWLGNDTSGGSPGQLEESPQ